MQTRSRARSTAVLASVLAASLAGCGDADHGTSASLSGQVLGGQAPIVGSTVQLMAAGTPPAPATVLASTTTDTSGNFHLGAPSCASPDQQLYLTATGGNPGAGTNTAINLLTIVGPCSSALRSYTVNELTTVAAAYGANRFIGPTGCVDCAASSPADVDNISGSSPGLPNALSTAAQLVDPGTGTLVLPDAGACASSPPVNCTTSRKLGSLANALAACVNTSGPTSSQCVQLFNCSVAGASAASTTACNLPAGATAPSETLSALLSIARNPVTVAKAGIYYTATRNVVFSPSLTSAPSDWAVSRTLAGGGLSGPESVAVDAQGNVWVANYVGNSLSKFGPDGIPLSPGTGYSGGGIGHPVGLAIDASGNVWTGNETGSTLSEFSSSGAAISPAGGYVGGGLNVPQALAFDTAGDAWTSDYNGNQLSEFTGSGSAIGSGFSGGGLNGPFGLAISRAGAVWVSDYGNNALSAFSTAGVAISPAGGYTGGGLSSPLGIAVDPDGNIWIANQSGSSLSKFSASGTALSGTGFTGGGLSGPFFLAVDAAGNAWAANQGTNSVSEHSSAGSALSPSSGFGSDGASSLRGVAIDASGNVWASGFNSATITELIGAAAPTRTPLVDTLSKGFEP
jgi:streptogramin lyase